MADVHIIETGAGGDAIFKGGDLVRANGYENAPYLSMFGGADWWGNHFMKDEDPSTLFNSKTEQALRDNALTSAGRNNIEQAIAADLDWMKQIPGTVLEISTAITAADRLEINITINGQLFALAWNPAEEYLSYRV